MVDFYNYGESVTSGTYDWTMAKTLQAQLTSLKTRGWNIQTTPLIGTPQAFGGMVGGEQWPVPTAQGVETQTKTFCQNGATGIIYYAWDNSGVTSTSQFPWNSTAITQGIKNGIADCKAIWNASTSPTSSFSPTSSPTNNPLATNFSLAICPHGLGNCGDNVNPNSGGNTNPLHPTRNVTLTILNGNNQQIAQNLGSVTYNTTVKNFQGNIGISNLATGSYLASVKLDGFLPKQIPGIITVGAQSIVPLPSVSLVIGDINNDNQLDILDYNLLITCFGSKANTSSCQNKTASDINDDGVIDGTDYNLFLRELSVQKGG